MLFLLCSVLLSISVIGSLPLNFLNKMATQQISPTALPFLSSLLGKYIPKIILCL